MSPSLKSSSWALALLLFACAQSPKPVQHAPVVEPSEARAAPSVAETTLFESSVPLMPRAVTSFGAAALGGAVYAFGGYSGVPHAYNREGQSGELWKLDPSKGTFEQLASSEPVQGAALVATSDALVRVGGMRASNREGEPENIASLDEVASYTPGATSWTALPALPKPRSSHAAAVVGKTLYVVGGWTLAGSAKTGEFADTTVALSLDTKEVRTLPQPFKARALAVAALDGKVVALGGMEPSGKLTRAVHVLDPKTNAWSKAADLPMDAFGIAAASNGDVLFASARDGDVYALDKVDGSWKSVASLAFPRFFHQLVALDAQRVVSLGGISGMHGGPRIRIVESVDVSKKEPRVLAFTLSNPSPARNRQGVFLVGDSLYVFGGNKSLGQHDFKPEDFTNVGARLDLASLTWAPMAAFPVARQTVQTMVDDGDEPRALALGGFGHDGSGEARAHADAYVYDVQNDRWSPDTSVLPTPRTQFGLATIDGQRWVFGGLDFKPEKQGEAQFDHPLSVLRGAPGRPFEPAGVELPEPRRAFAGALLDGRYYLVGGMAGGFSPVTSCDVFEVASAKWSHLPCPKATRISGQLVALGGKLYLAGGSSVGEGGLTPNRSLEVFDPKANKWSTLIESLPIEPRHLTMLAYEKSLVLYSAHDKEGRAHVVIVTP